MEVVSCNQNSITSWSIGEYGVLEEYLDIGHLSKKHEIEWYCKSMLQKRVP